MFSLLFHFPPQTSLGQTLRLTAPRLDGKWFKISLNCLNSFYQDWNGYPTIDIHPLSTVGSNHWATEYFYLTPERKDFRQRIHRPFLLYIHGSSHWYLEAKLLLRYDTFDQFTSSRPSRYWPISQLELMELASDRLIVSPVFS